MKISRCQGRGARLALTAFLMLAVAGCASTPRDASARDPYDPFEPLNRQVWAFNQAADRALLRPIARGYDKVVPRPVKWSVANFFDNLGTPIWALNHLLQGNFADAGRQTGRFVLNSTLGLLGLWDPAGDNGLPRQPARFDQTFGKWGVPSGPFIMMPFLGPSSARGAAGMYARYQTDIVWNRLDDERSIRDKLVVLEIVDTRRRLLPLDSTIERAADSYIFVREAYRQRAEFAIDGPGKPDDDISLDFEDEDWGDEDWDEGG
jgi:phospholipid-binding lipoprotein MlaA